LSVEGDDPGLTDRVGPPVSEREATAKSDKRSMRRLNQTSGAGQIDNGLWQILFKIFKQRFGF
jgi:hypothetical protein